MDIKTKNLPFLSDYYLEKENDLTYKYTKVPTGCLLYFHLTLPGN